MRAAAWGSAAVMTLLSVQAGTEREYRDPAGRFQFSYPAEFGLPSPGTDNGFGDRLAAIRFSVFSAGIGGEVALTRGFPVVDIQAVGGLYDAITLQVFPDALRRVIVGGLVPLSAANFCREIAQEQHLDLRAPSLATLTAEQRTMIAATDRIRNVSPRVLQCVVDGPTVTFDKEVGFAPDGPRQRVYGAVRFLDSPYSTFQVVRAGAAPDAGVLRQMTALVKSWIRL